MPSNYNGLSANVFPNLPLAVNIASSTNATPIVVETSAPHLLTSGDAVVITGHLVNTAANGHWIATVIDATHFVIKWITGANSIGNGVGVNTGVAQSAGFGVVYPIPSGNDLERAVSVNVALESLGDRTAALLFTLLFAPTVYAGGTSTLMPGSILNIGGRTVYRAPYRPADAATIDVDTTLGDVVILPIPGGGGPHTVQLKTSVNPPINDERVRLVLPPAAADGLYWHVKREDGTVICDLYGFTVQVGGADQNGSTWVECQYEGGHWRGGISSGVVVPGAGW